MGCAPFRGSSPAEWRVLWKSRNSLARSGLAPGDPTSVPDSPWRFGLFSTGTGFCPCGRPKTEIGISAHPALAAPVEAIHPAAHARVIAPNPPDKAGGQGCEFTSNSALRERFGRPKEYSQPAKMKRPHSVANPPSQRCAPGAPLLCADRIYVRTTTLIINPKKGTHTMPKTCRPPPSIWRSLAVHFETPNPKNERIISSCFYKQNLQNHRL